MSATAPLERALWTMLSPAGGRARLVILSFHRVLAQPDPLLSGEPDARHFEAILRWLSERCQVLPLEAAVRRLDEGTLPARAVAITFDDGYRNNLEVAKPALAAAGLPATVFVATEPVRHGIMWNDRIIEAVRDASGTCDLSDLGLEAVCVDDSNRWPSIERLIAALKYRPLAEREELSCEVFRRLAGGEPARQMLTEDEVARLAGDGITLGGHTTHHPILTRLPDDQARSQIEDNRRWIHELCGRPPALFAYPNGRAGDDYDHRHVAMVRQAGFKAAVSTRWSAAHARSPRFELPRFTPWETSSWGFTSRVLKTCAASYLN